MEKQWLKIMAKVPIAKLAILLPMKWSFPRWGPGLEPISNQLQSNFVPHISNQTTFKMDQSAITLKGSF